jgi:hypothetical protein
LANGSISLPSKGIFAFNLIPFDLSSKLETENNYILIGNSSNKAIDGQIFLNFNLSNLSKTNLIPFDFSHKKLILGP